MTKKIGHLAYIAYIFKIIKTGSRLLTGNDSLMSLKLCLDYKKVKIARLQRKMQPVTVGARKSHIFTK